jgi:formyltetrahydrofolate synthetase
VELADAVLEAASAKNEFRYLYPLDATLRDKIETIAREIYGADGVAFSETADRDIERWETLGFGRLPICMAKTHLSLSHDPDVKGAPSGFTLPIREVRVSAGAGFVYPLCGDMQTMPGLPARPVFMDIDLDEAGEPLGLS